MVSIESQALREQLRNLHLDESRGSRQQNVDAVRLGLGLCVDEVTQLDSISVKDVLGLAGRIKRRRKADPQDMLRLSRAFQQDGANSTAFTNTPGALNVLIKELTGHEMETQILACECLCNLALGAEVACNKVVLAASSYLLTILDCTCPRLQITSLWTITNLCAASSADAVSVFISQKLVTKLVSFLANQSILSEIVTEAQTTLNCLLVKHPFLVRKEVQIDELLVALIEVLGFSHCTSWINFSIIYHACEAYEYQIDQTMRLKLLRAICINLNRYILIANNTKIEGIVKMCIFALRTIGNIIVEDVLSMDEWKRLLESEPTLIQRILGLDDVLARDVLWVVAVTEYENVGILQVPSSVRAGVFT